MSYDEIEEITELQRQVYRLKAENKKLREALQKIADWDLAFGPSDIIGMRNIAIKILYPGQ